MAALGGRVSYEPQNLEVIPFLQERCTILYTLLAFVQFSEQVQMVDIFGVDFNLQNFRISSAFLSVALNEVD